ncbi:hypothetical protein F4604DRAFT_1678328 [Suillus subluteus]|nr:hypothetical protein F4604DRAFT_1678328 [Suillus subluteus]
MKNEFVGSMRRGGRYDERVCGLPCLSKLRSRDGFLIWDGGSPRLRTEKQGRFPDMGRRSRDGFPIWDGGVPAWERRSRDGSRIWGRGNGDGGRDGDGDGGATAGVRSSETYGYTNVLAYFHHGLQDA